MFIQRVHGRLQVVISGRQHTIKAGGVEGV
jgi:hypothetical protein